jgi:hypothetical protein
MFASGRGQIMDVISFERVHADYHNYWDGGAAGMVNYIGFVWLIILTRG